VGLKSLKSQNLTNVYPNNKNKNKVKSKPLELYELAGKNIPLFAKHFRCGGICKKQVHLLKI
jgi:hypothetical protein